MKRRDLMMGAAAAGLLIRSGRSYGQGMDAARRWVDTEFQPSTLSKDEQMREMQWFVDAAKLFQGMDIAAVSETLTTHEYESRTLAQAFSEITGIRLKHDVIQEGDVVEKIQTEMS